MAWPLGGRVRHAHHPPPWFRHQKRLELSGGQKQLLNLASIMAMQPPSSSWTSPPASWIPLPQVISLPPWKINRELGTTILLTEHRLEEAVPLATTVAVMDRGALLCTGTPPRGGRAATAERTYHVPGHAHPPMRIWAAVNDSAPCPVTVGRAGSGWPVSQAGRKSNRCAAEPQLPKGGDVVVLQGRELWFKYDKDLPDVVKGLSCPCGRGNSSLCWGATAPEDHQPQAALRPAEALSGELEISGSVGMLPQNPQTLFVKKTVREDLYEILRAGNSQERQDQRVAHVTALCRLEELLDRHPYDLSGGGSSSGPPWPRCCC